MYQSFEGCVTNDVTAANLLGNASLCRKPDKYCSQNANLPTTYKITQLYMVEMLESCANETPC